MKINVNKKLALQQVSSTHVQSFDGLNKFLFELVV